ncbi:MAG TPA: helix-turn-helix transcriptional regulator [Gemmatimonadaceae bacterium]|nr:helix-turn-helix transcriptional regulator [Gemmatimonadaceae bacterium]
MDDVHRRLIANIKARAKRRRLSANKLADFADVGRGYLSDVLAGHKSPTVRTLVKLATALEVDIRELFE